MTAKIIVLIIVAIIVVRLFVANIGRIWGILGLITLLFTITTLYYMGTTPKEIEKDDIANSSMMIIDGTANTFQRITIENGKRVVHESVVMDEKVNLIFLSKFKYLVIKNPSGGDFKVDTFKCGEYDFVGGDNFDGNHYFRNYHADKHIQEWRGAWKGEDRRPVEIYKE